MPTEQSILDTFMQFFPSLPVALQIALTALGGLVVLGQIYIAATPTKRDDAWFAKLEATAGLGTVLRVLKSFAPIQRKGE